MLRRVLDNPMLVRHVRSRLRPAQTLAYVVVIVVLSGMLLWAGAAAGGIGRAFPWTIGLQGVILLLLGASQVGSSAGAARDSGILEFHRASPMSPFDLALGFLLGAPIREYVAALCVTPFAVAAAASSSVGVVGYSILFGLLLTGSLLFHSIAMIGGLVGGKRGNIGILAVILCYIFGARPFGGIGLPSALTIVPAYMEVQSDDRAAMKTAREELRPQFFGQDVPVSIQSYVYQTSFLVLAFVCCVRRMSAADRPIYSKTQGALALAALGALAMGALVNSRAPSSATMRWLALNYVLGTAGITMAAAVTPSRGDWANGIRRAARLGRTRPQPLHDWAANFVCVVIYTAVIAGLSSAAALAVAPAIRASGEQWMERAAVTALTITCFGWGLQYCYLRFGRIGPVFFGLFLFFLWVVPLMLGSVLTL